MNQKLGALLAGILFVFCGPAEMVMGQDVGEAVVERAEFFTQCTTNRADTALDLGHSILLDVFPAFSGAVLSGTVTMPDGSSVSLIDFGDSFSTNPVLSSAASPGTYVFQVNTVGGAQTVKVSLPSVAKGIAPARVANCPETQAVDASQDFMVAWDKVPKLGSHDYIFFHVFETNGTLAFDSQKLDPLQTGSIIPAGTLQPNTTYRAYVYLRHYFFLKNSKLPYSAATELTATRFTLKTLNPAGVFQFGPNPVLASKQDGTASMVVLRAQGSQGDVTVDYFSNDRTARSGTNYSAATGTLDFPDGVTNQTITVPLLDDGLTNSPLDFLLTLTNATGGAGLVTRPHATVTIVDSRDTTEPDVNAYMLARVHFYTQSGTNAPTQSNVCVAARFYGSIHPKFPGTVSNAMLKLPKGAGIILTNDHDFLEYNVDFPSIVPMDKTFPGGKYQMSFSTLAGASFSPTLTLGTEKKLPVPYVTNATALESVDPSASLTLGWESFTGATSNDYVLVSIRDASGEYLLRTPLEFESGALPGTTPSFTVPANTLDYGQTYSGDLIFSKMIEGKQVYPGVRNGVASVNTTSFQIKTISSPAAPAQALLPQNQDADCPCHSEFQLPPQVLERDSPEL